VGCKGRKERSADCILSTLLVKQEKQDWPLYGTNPQIFSYQFGSKWYNMQKKL